MTRTGALLIAILVSSCAHFSSDTERELVLFNPAIEGSQMEVSVLSNGCTQASDFYLKVTETVIEMRRTKPDVCRRASHLIRLSFEFPFERGVYEFKNDVRFSDRLERR